MTASMTVAELLTGLPACFELLRIVAAEDDDLLAGLAAKARDVEACGQHSERRSWSSEVTKWGRRDGPHSTVEWTDVLIRGFTERHNRLEDNPVLDQNTKSIATTKTNGHICLHFRRGSGPSFRPLEHLVLRPFGSVPDPDLANQTFVFIGRYMNMASTTDNIY